MIEWEILAGWSALVAAAATVLGMIALLLFFSRGQPWGTINDAASVVLMVAMIPVALLVGTLETETQTTTSLVVTAIGIIGMVVVIGLQGALVAGVLTYDQVKRPVLAAGGVVGVWYLLAGLLAGGTGIAGPPAALAMISGAGFIAVGIGFGVAGERHPLSVVGGLALFLGSTTFLIWLGVRLVTADLVVPTWNA